MRKTYFLIVSLLGGGIMYNVVCARTVEKRSLAIKQMFELAEQNNSRKKVHATATKQALKKVTGCLIISETL